MALTAAQQKELDRIASQSFVDPNIKSAILKRGQNLSEEEQKTVQSKALSPEGVAQFQRSLPTTTPAPRALPQTPTDNFTNLAGALNKAVSMARQQRQSAQLDFLGGKIPPGSVSASTFTGLLGSLNQASDSFSQPIVNDVLDFAKEEQARVAEEKTSIRDLSLKLATSGVKPETISAILAAPDIDSALSMAAAAMQTTTKKGTVENVGGHLVQYDEEGNVQVLFSPPKTASGGGGSTGLFTSGGLQGSNSDVGKLSSTLEASRGSDSYANTQLYIDAYSEWTRNGGLPKDFFSRFDPDIYLNPNDPSIPVTIRNFMRKQDSGVANPFD